MTNKTPSNDAAGAGPRPVAGRDVLRRAFSAHQTLRACLDAGVLGLSGAILAGGPRPDSPALIQVGFLFLGGDPRREGAEAVVRLIPPRRLTLAPGGWRRRLEAAWGRRFLSIRRFSFAGFDRRGAPPGPRGRLPEGLEVRRIGPRVASRLQDDLGCEAVSNYASVGDFLRRGGGYCICDGDVLASAAAYLAVSDRGAEVAVVTHPLYRRSGFATAVCEALLRDCLDRGLEPGWDAAHEGSRDLGLKLGFYGPKPYRAYFFEE